MKRLTRIASKATTEWERAVQRLSAALGLRRSVCILESRLVDVPTVIGWLRPVILLPVSALTGMSTEQLETIVAHELAHIRRYDFLVNFLQTIVETVFFYHPATWWISRQIRIERENCCDDDAVAVCGDPLVYARALADLEHLRVSTLPALGANGGSLMARVRRVVSGPTRRCSSRWLAGISVIAVAALFLIATPITIFAVRNANAFGTIAGEDVTVTASRPRESAVPSSINRSLPAVAAVLSDLSLSNAILLSETMLEEEAEEIESADEDGHVAEENHQAHIVTGEIDLDDLIALKRHNVSPEMLKELRKLGHDDLDLEDAIAASVHGITAEFIKGMRDAGYPDLEMEDLVAMRIHGVKPEFVAELRKVGFPKIDAETLTALAIHGVSPKFIDAMRKAGVKLDDVDELVTLKIHGVNPKLVSELKSLGLKDLDADEIAGMAVHGVTPEFVREMRATGYPSLSLEDLQAFRIHGVSAGFIEEMKQSGLKDLDADDLVTFRIHGVTAEFMRSLREAGLTDLDKDEVIKMKIHGLSPEDLKKFGNR